MRWTLLGIWPNTNIRHASHREIHNTHKARCTSHDELLLNIHLNMFFISISQQEVFCWFSWTPTTIGGFSTKITYFTVYLSLRNDDILFTFFQKYFQDASWFRQPFYWWIKPKYFDPKLAQPHKSCYTFKGLSTFNGNICQVTKISIGSMSLVWNLQKDPVKNVNNSFKHFMPKLARNWLSICFWGYTQTSENNW